MPSPRTPIRAQATGLVASRKLDVTAGLKRKVVDGRVRRRALRSALCPTGLPAPLSFACPPTRCLSLALGTLAAVTSPSLPPTRHPPP